MRNPIEDIIDLWQEVKKKHPREWNWDIIFKLITAGVICWLYLCLCEWNCTRRGDYWDNETYTCRYTPPSEWRK